MKAGELARSGDEELMEKCGPLAPIKSFTDALATSHKTATLKGNISEDSIV